MHDESANVSDSLHCMVLKKVNVETQCCSKVLCTFGKFIALRAAPIHVAFQFVSHPNESPVSKTAVLWSRSAIGCILMCQAGRADLNLGMIFTYDLCVLVGLWLGDENRSQFHAAQALAEVMNLLHGDSNPRLEKCLILYFGQRWCHTATP